MSMQSSQNHVVDSVEIPNLIVDISALFSLDISSIISVSTSSIITNSS